MVLERTKTLQSAAEFEANDGREGMQKKKKKIIGIRCVV